MAFKRTFYPTTVNFSPVFTATSSSLSPVGAFQPSQATLRALLALHVYFCICVSAYKSICIPTLSLCAHFKFLSPSYLEPTPSFHVISLVFPDSTACPQLFFNCNIHCDHAIFDKKANHGEKATTTTTKCTNTSSTDCYDRVILEKKVTRPGIGPRTFPLLSGCSTN